MSDSRIYQEPLIVDKENDLLMRECLLTHLRIINHVANEIAKNPKLNFKEIKLLCEKYIEEKKLTKLFLPALYNEVYYLRKKHKYGKGDCKKSLDKVQYLTYVVSNFTNKCFVVKDQILTLNGLNCKLQLTKPFPVVAKKTSMYINISFFEQTNSYQLSIYLK